jgi:ssDNA-binding Zn-finger/Zn-ribbon topoisomerase 1
VDDPALTPVEMECMRCGTRAAMRFYGPCPACRDELRAKYSREGREIAVEDYEPKTNVTPNAVALKDD